MNRSSAAGLAERAFAASRSVGIGWAEISLIELVAQNDHVLAVAWQQYSGQDLAEYQILASVMKLKRAQWTTAARSL